MAEKYLFDETMQEFLAQSNPWASQAMAERLLEAADRGMSVFFNYSVLGAIA